MHRAGLHVGSAARAWSLASRASSSVSASRAPGPTSLWPCGATLDIVESRPRRPAPPTGSWTAGHDQLGLALARSAGSPAAGTASSARGSRRRSGSCTRPGSGATARRRRSAGRCTAAASCRRRSARTPRGPTPQMLPMPPRMTMIRTRIEIEKSKKSEVDGAEVGRLERSGDAGEAGAEGEREQLGPDRVDAHHLGRRLVLADGAPGPADPRALQVARDDDGDAAAGTARR